MKRYLLIAATLATIAVGISSPAHAVQKEKVNLIATIEDRPAFRPVTWKVYEIHNNRLSGKSEEVLVTTGKRHVFSVDIKPGVYAAVAQADEHKTRYEFTVRANTPRDLVVPLDQH